MTERKDRLAEFAAACERGDFPIEDIPIRYVQYTQGLTEEQVDQLRKDMYLVNLPCHPTVH